MSSPNSNLPDSLNEHEGIRLTNLTQEQQPPKCKTGLVSGDDNTDTKCPQDFDDVLEMVGSVGNYQRFLLYGILVPISIFESLFLINLWFLIDEPDHWCHVPGGEKLDINHWKNLTIPRDANGEFSKCTMFDTSTAITEGFNTTAAASIVDCNSGWDYDFSIAEYHSILTDYNWVCDKSHWTTYVHSGVNTGRAIGTFILGFLADKLGRRPIFIITLILFSFGRATALFFAYDIRIFVALAVVTGMSSPMFAISVNTIVLELSGQKFRAWIYALTWSTLVIGVAMVPGIALVVPNWFILGWTTILLGSMTYLLLPWIPESPRWLLDQGRTGEVVEILKVVAKWNGTSHKIKEQELHQVLHEMGKSNEENNSGESVLLKLISNRNVGIHALLLTFTWVMNGLVFHGLNLFSVNLNGNRFLNFFLVQLMEVPGGLVGGVLINRFGRRWMQVLFLLVTGVACSVAAYASIYVGGSEDTGFITLAVVIAANIAKFTITMSFLAIYLQAAELFPTSIRTTISGWASTTASVTGILVPFIIYTGKSSKTTPWIITAIVAFTGMTAAAFIPETLNYNLPETMEEADNFGKDRKFWSFRLPKPSKLEKGGG